jgi:choline dehydrogenase
MEPMANVLVVGGGTSGAALAGLLARDPTQRVLLLEAGPDYGALDEGRWPSELLDARRIPLTHEWGYSGRNHPSQREPHAYNRARVIGGCSSHNGCVALLGHRRDYDGWAELGNEGWAWDDVAPAFERAKRSLRVRIPDRAELTPFQAGYIEAAVAAGIPLVSDLNDPDDVEGVASSPANIHDGTRWNTALAYLDPVRGLGNLTVVGNALVERVIIENGRATAVEAIVDGRRERYVAEQIVLAAGAYGSPAILLRSGIGPADELARHGIPVVHDLPGVGLALTDHPVLHVELRPGAELERQMAAFAESNWTPDEQALLKARSSRCTEAFDLHLYAVGGADLQSGEQIYVIEVSCIIPRSSGRLRLASADPEALPEIDHGYLTDPEGHDLAVLLDGLALARRIAANIRDAGLIEGVIAPQDSLASLDELSRWGEETVGIYYHPACSCRMGPASDPLAVVEPRGRVHGLDGLSICDASIFPTIMRANTNLPAAMLAEHMARWLT